MAFEVDNCPPDGPTELIAEHQCLVDLLQRHPHWGYLDLLNQRFIDRERGAALYYIQGFGMGHGRTFALVQNKQIVRFDVTRAMRASDSAHPPIDVTKLTIPEQLDGKRSDIQSLIKDALAAYNQQNPLALWFPGEMEPNFDRARWVLVPQKYSKLYWREKTTAWWTRQTPKLAKLRDFLTSPLIALAALGGLLALAWMEANVPILALVLSGAWLCLRLNRYDDDYVFGFWLVGQTRFKNALLASSLAMQRIMEPAPLKAMAVVVHFPPDHLRSCTIEVVNTTFFLVPFFSIGAYDLADLLAPGFTDVLRAKNGGAINAKDMESAFPSLQRKWLLPRQTVSWQVPLLNDHPPKDPGPEVKAIVTISRIVSGESKHGPRTYCLPVTTNIISRARERFKSSEH